MNNPRVGAVCVSADARVMTSPVNDPDSIPTQCLGGALCPLNHARAGATVRIKRLPDATDVTTRLREIGLCEEQTVKLISTNANVICQVCNSRLAISNHLAQCILVEPVTGRPT